MKKFLLAYGLIAFSVFLYSGYTMQEGFPEFYAEDKSIRFLFRANHIYLLFSALLILMYASVYNDSENKQSKILQIITATILIIANIILITAFFSEPQLASEIRPLSYYGVLTTLAGVTLAVFSGFSRLDKKPLTK